MGQAPTDQKQDIPDAPSTVQPPPPPLPEPSPSAKQPEAPANDAPPSSDSPAPGDNSAGPPSMKISTVPEGSVAKSQSPSQEELYKLVVNVNQVVVPVRVTDEDGRLVS